ncbi:MAG TPA: CHAD domain-containing protein [Gaiellaceae bacterium]|nr:CHAD domain-containing protein [Gaiellaceae bacterium]
MHAIGAGRPDPEAIRLRAFELSQGPERANDVDNWLRAERELSVEHGYDTVDRDLERLGIAISRLPVEAGVVWRLSLPRGERVEEWEPGNDGLAPPAEIARLIAAVVGGKPLVPGPPLAREPGALRLRERIESQRLALISHDPGSRLGADPENLHQHRVAGRRARAFLHATKEFVDPEWRRSVTAPLRELASATGPVRDLDVLLEHVRGQAESLDEPDRTGAAWLVAALEEQRALARRELLTALDGDGYRLLLARLRLPPRLAPGVERVRLERIAQKELRRLTKAVNRLGKRPKDGDLHGLRIQLKRTRYAAELGPSGGAKRKRFLEHAGALQDVLGEYQDAVVAEERLRRATVVDPQTAAAYVAGRIAERQAGRRSAAAKQLPAAWKLLRKSGRKLR